MENKDFATRRSYGKNGTPIQVFVNHFKVELQMKNDIYHYDVGIGDEKGSFSNEGPPKALAMILFESLLKQLKAAFPDYAIVGDGRKNIYTSKELPFTERVFEDVPVPDDDRQRKRNCRVQAADPLAVRVEPLDQLFQGRLNYTPYDVIQGLDIALRHHAHGSFVPVGRNFFSNAQAADIGEGAEVWFGYHQSLRPTQSRLVLNIDMAATAFVKSMPVLDYLDETLNLRNFPTSLNRPQHAQFSKAIRGVKVKILHRPGVKRQYRVNGLSPNGASQMLFTDDSGKKVSIADYFASHYRPLKYPNLPCLHVGALQKSNYLPMEVCHILEGQKCPRKATDNQVANMIRYTCTKPHVRKAAIEEKVRSAGFEQDSLLQGFGLKVNPEMPTVNARILPCPPMLYGGKKIEKPSDGAWNMKGKQFYEPRQLKSWAVINLCDPRKTPNESVENFFEAFIDQIKKVGMKSPNQLPPIIPRRDRNTEIRSLFKTAMTEAQKKFGTKAELIFMINPSADSFNYGELKRASDSEFGVVSQCMLAKHINKCSPQYIANILLKVNVKLGGRNTIVNGPLPKASDIPTIIFGADVTHPSPSDKSQPSIAAVVASMDRYAISHAATIRQQGRRVEQIEDLKGMAIDLLKRFYVSARTKPQRIIFYRDGVSEGQFQMVMNYEITALREACAALEKGYNPTITFVIVQKRHHTRFFVTDNRDADRSGNVKAGTVIDTGCCHPTEFDFYLMSHSGIQGTSRPTHYHVVLNEGSFSADEIQELTYRLCYTFARCTRSVSIVPAAYYAHLLAFRARFFNLDGSDAGSTAGSISSNEPVRMLEVHQNLSHSMFYV